MAKKLLIIVSIMYTSLCFSNPSIYHKNWIDFNKNGKKDVYEDKTRSIEDRIEDLLSQMNIKEKTNQLVTLYGYGRVQKDELPTKKWETELWIDGLANIDEASNGVATKAKYTSPEEHVWALNTIQKFFIEKTRLGIPVEFTNEGIRGLNHVNSTNFPAQIGMGSTWNKNLLYKVGQIIGKEAYALGYNNIYSPVLDVARDQRWGRIVESYGEDPFLVGEYGVHISRGIQQQGVTNTLKHFAVYSAPKGGRDGHVRLDPHVAPRDMHQMYLAPFKRTIEQTEVLGIMSSYNDYDGIPVTGSYYFLTELLRDSYGFKGYVVSDSDALIHIYSKHRVAKSYKEAIKQAIEAGLNVRTTFNHPKNFIKPLRELIEEGKLSEEIINKRVREVLFVKFKEGLFDKPLKDEKGANSLIKTKQHKEVSLQASRESIILLKNHNRALPLDFKDLNKVLVCGPTAKAQSSSISRYGSLKIDVISGYQGIINYLKNKKNSKGKSIEVAFEEGCNLRNKDWPDSEVLDLDPSKEEQEMINKAVEKAKQADVVLLFVGEDETCVGENLSRTSLDLPSQQKKLVKALLKTGKKIIVTLISGHPLSVNLCDRSADAILAAWFPGEFGGIAIAETLFGEYNPGGKTPVTYLRTAGQVPYNFPYKPYSQKGQAHEGPNGTGDSRIVTELYPFGFGLSYTKFKIDNLKINNQLSTKSGNLTAECTIKNTGKVLGDEVVQLYIQDKYSSVTTYEWQLRGFERVKLKPGETKKLKFKLTPKDLELLNRDMKFVVEPGVFKLRIGNSSVNSQLETEFEIK